MLRVVIFSLYVASIWASPFSVGHSKIHPLNLKGSRIIHGQEAKQGQFPWQIALHVTGDGVGWFCGGSIISEEWILTAGHCVSGGISGRIVSGSLSPSDGTSTTIKEFVLHEEYNGDNLANDIGLVRLSKPLKFDANTAAVTLSSEELQAGSEITVSGWGLTSDDSSTISPSLNFVNLVTISNKECDEVYGVIGNEMVCATSDTSTIKSTCSGDSGGPVILNSDSITGHVHVAVVSFVSNDGCESGAPSGYTRTAPYRDWIKGKTGV